MTAGRFGAVVFDLDGVLWDGEPLYHEAFNVVLKPYGHSIALTDPGYTGIIGKSVEAAWDWMRNRFALTESPVVFYRAYDEAVLELMKQPREPLPGVRELLAELKARGVPIGLASASLRNWVDATLAGLGLNGAFATTVTASEVEQSKPAPDLYLTAAKAAGRSAGELRGVRRHAVRDCVGAGGRDVRGAGACEFDGAAAAAGSGHGDR